MANGKGGENKQRTHKGRHLIFDPVSVRSTCRTKHRDGVAMLPARPSQLAMPPSPHASPGHVQGEETHELSGVCKDTNPLGSEPSLRTLLLSQRPISKYGHAGWVRASNYGMGGRGTVTHVQSVRHKFILNFAHMLRTLPTYPVSRFQGK